MDLDSAEPGAAAERFDRSEPAVGGCRSAETDEHRAGALVDRLGDQFTRAPGRRRERVIVLRSAGEDQPTRPGHLDDCRAAVDPPRGLDGCAKWPGHHGGSVAAPEHIEQAFPAVGHRNFVAVGAELPARCSDRDGRLGSSERAAELVEGGDDPHPRTVVSNRRVPVGPKRHIGTLRSSPAAIPDLGGKVSGMAVTVRIPTTMRPLSGGASTIEAAPGTLSDVIAELEQRHPGFAERLLDEGALRRFVNVFVDDDDVRYLQGLDTKVPDGQTVSIIPAVAGG